MGRKYLKGLALILLVCALAGCRVKPPPGNGASYIEITTAEGLCQFSKRVNNGENTLNAKLKNDIVLSQNDGFAGIGYWKGSQDYREYLGVFDGQGYSISGVNIDKKDRDCIGLFGLLGKGGIVRNIGLTTGSISGKNRVGGIVGWNCGTVENCYNRAAVSGYDNVGGVVGSNYDANQLSDEVTIDGAGMVRYSLNTGEITAVGSEVGGVAGSNSGSVSGCYNLASIIAASDSQKVGGIVGCNYKIGVLENSYAVAKINPSGKAGGVIGENSNDGGVKNNYYNREYMKDAIDSATSGVTPKTTNEMQSPEFLTLLNQGSTIFKSGGSGKYPKLSWEK